MTSSLLIGKFAAHIGGSSALIALAYAFRVAITRYFQGLLSRSRVLDASQRPRDLLFLCGSAFAAVSLASALAGLPIWINAPASGVVAALLPRALMRLKKKRYLKEFDASLPESLQTVASSLKAGLTLKDSLHVASENTPPVFADAATLALREYHFGLSMEECLDNLRRRIDTPNCNIAFGSMIISSRLGGRLPEMLQRIVKTIRERERVEGRLKALTAQGRAQAFLLCAAPPVIFVGMYIYDPSRVALLTDLWIGQILLALAIVLEIVGIFVTSRVLRLEV